MMTVATATAIITGMTTIVIVEATTEIRITGLPTTVRDITIPDGVVINGVIDTAESRTSTTGCAGKSWTSGPMV
jgi:hypothetical protein